MIDHNVTYGTVEGVTVLQFGTGDIRMHAVKYGPEQGPEFPYAGVIFKNDEPQPIGTVQPKVEQQTSNDVQPEVVMIFTKVASIDALIETLQEARQDLVIILDA